MNVSGMSTNMVGITMLMIRGVGKIGKMPFALLEHHHRNFHQILVKSYCAHPVNCQKLYGVHLHQRKYAASSLMTMFYYYTRVTQIWMVLDNSEILLKGLDVSFKKWGTCMG
jgi:hypothetical protein